MKTKLSIATLALLTFFSAGSAFADGHAHVGISVGIGVPAYGYGYYGPHYGYYGPRYYPYPYPYPYAYPAYYPAAVYPAAPVVVSQPVVTQSQVYVEQPQAQGSVHPQENSPYWYYCADSKTYYPYVKSCASGWQQETPQPPQH